ncbi:MAG: hypothetical protein BWY75_03697 [bacterium ADurb.Bin425]|nr:MAG: hypothetical protein BWY75_03697 [bacterium ADurb.Bin425]
MGAAGTGNDAETNFGEAQLCCIDHHSKIASQSQFKTTTPGGAVDSGYNRLRLLFDCTHHLLNEGDIVEGLALGHPLALSQVGTGAERL